MIAARAGAVNVARLLLDYLEIDRYHKNQVSLERIITVS